ncbi:MAG TPA: SGNH/GDSL hydrolase family protein [Rhodothermales bacterium]|nr:SGNH/GDSL hydrolase family protein [Rhodothermales bacterium]
MLLRLRSLWACALFILLSFPAQAQQAPFYLKDGDVVVFYGDSITEQRLYTTFVEEYVLTRFPDLHVTFVHSGVGGDKVSGGWAGSIDERLDRDLIAYHPTVVTIMLGMNDGLYRSFDPDVMDAYTTGYQHIIEKVTKALPSIRITLIRPSPFDDVTRPATVEGGYNTVMQRYGEYVAHLGQQRGFVVADLNAPVVADLQKAFAAEPEVAKLIIPDRVHPGAAGHWIMAEALLKSWNAPAVVTSLALNFRDHTVIAENTTVSDLKQDGDTLWWTQLDKALPLPVSWQDGTVALALHSSDFVQTLDLQRLQAVGLSAGHYMLMIDDSRIGEFSADELANSINLAVLSTPMTQQAMSVHWATQDHNDAHAMLFRLLVHKDDDPDYERAARILAAYEARAVEAQRAAAQPKPHRYRLERLKD